MTRAFGAAVALAAYAAACSGSTGAPAAPQSTGPICPPTLDATLGAPCDAEGLRCGPQYTCGLSPVAVLCVCTRGSFSCVDGRGEALSSAPACPAPASAPACPAAESIAEGAPCALTGQLCAYPSACASGFDECDCAPGAASDGGGYLRFSCRTATCAGAPAQGGVDDAGAEEPSDSAETMDAAAADGRSLPGSPEGGVDVGATNGGDASIDDAPPD